MIIIKTSYPWPTLFINHLFLNTVDHGYQFHSDMSSEDRESSFNIIHQNTELLFDKEEEKLFNHEKKPI